MKKFFAFTASLIFFCFLVFSCVQSGTKKENGIWRLEKIEDLKIMSIKQDGTPFSDAQSALFLKKIRYESLPVSAVFFFTNPSSLGNPKEIICRVVYKDIEIKKTIKNLNISSERSFFRSSGVLSFNLSNLKKTRTEQEILEFMKAFPLDAQIKYSIKPVYHSGVQQDWINLY
jgi:hypothetical protein